MSKEISTKERLKYYKKEWLKNNIVHIILQVCLWFAIVTCAKLVFSLEAGMLGGVSGVTAVIIAGRVNNEMMRYAEDNAFDGSGE